METSGRIYEYSENKRDPKTDPSSSSKVRILVGPANLQVGDPEFRVYQIGRVMRATLPLTSSTPRRWELATDAACDDPKTLGTGEVLSGFRDCIDLTLAEFGIQPGEPFGIMVHRVVVSPEGDCKVSMARYLERCTQDGMFLDVGMNHTLHVYCGSVGGVREMTQEQVAFVTRIRTSAG